VWGGGGHLYDIIGESTREIFDIAERQNFHKYKWRRRVFLSTEAGRHLSLFLNWRGVLNDPRMIFHCRQFHSLSGIFHQKPTTNVTPVAKLNVGQEEDQTHLPIKSRAPLVT
jgi:hypothetical protein